MRNIRSSNRTGLNSKNRKVNPKEYTNQSNKKNDESNTKKIAKKNEVVIDSEIEGKNKKTIEKKNTLKKKTLKTSKNAVKNKKAIKTVNKKISSNKIDYKNKTEIDRVQNKLSVREDYMYCTKVHGRQREVLKFVKKLLEERGDNLVFSFKLDELLGSKSNTIATLDKMKKRGFLKVVQEGERRAYQYRIIKIDESILDLV